MEKVVMIRNIEHPHISVIVPTLNGAKSLERCLKSIRNQDFADFELIVSDGSSNDETMEIAKRYADRIVVSGRRGTAIQQNNGATVSRGKILVFIHQDVIISPNYLSMVKFYSDKFNVGKSFFEVESSIIDILYKKFSTVIDIALSPFNFTSGANQLFVRSEDFGRVGGFKNVYFWDLELFRNIRKSGKITMMKNASCVLVFNCSKIDLLKKSLGYLIFGILDMVGYHRKP